MCTPHLFEPFFTTKEVGKGTGLGLATCYGIAKQHGGHIGIYSEAGQGANFKIYLPQVDEAPDAAFQRERDDVPRGTETVLLAEDEAWVRKLARTILQAQGYTVLDASNGAEALQVVQANAVTAIDLVIAVAHPRWAQALGYRYEGHLRGLIQATKVAFVLVACPFMGWARRKS